MGSEIHITCDSCDVDITEEIGYGMMGIGILVCVCDTCRIFAIRKHNARLNSKPRPVYRCGKCRKPLRIIAPIDNDSDDDDWLLGPSDDDPDDNDLLLGPCPICGGKLHGESTGLLWC